MLLFLCQSLARSSRKPDSRETRWAGLLVGYGGGFPDPQQGREHQKSAQSFLESAHFMPIIWHFYIASGIQLRLLQAATDSEASVGPIPLLEAISAPLD